MGAARGVKTLALQVVAGNAAAMPLYPPWFCACRDQPVLGKMTVGRRLYPLASQAQARITHSLPPNS